MNILLFGKGGQVGWEHQRSLAAFGHLTALGFDRTSRCGDFSNLQGLADTVRTVRPDVIVDAAAHTAVDKAQSEPELARMLNALTPGVLAWTSCHNSSMSIVGPRPLGLERDTHVVPMDHPEWLNPRFADWYRFSIQKL